MNNPFEIIIASDELHDHVFAEIHFDGKFVALVNQELGRDSAVVEFAEVGLDEDQILRAVSLKEFQRALVAALERLAGEGEPKVPGTDS